MRNSAWWFSLGFCVLMAVLGVISVWSDLTGDDGTTWKTYVLCVAVPLFAVGAVRCGRAGVRVGPDGIQVISELSTRTIAWSEVDSFEIDGGVRYFAWLAVRRPDGSRYRLASGSAAVRADRLADLKELLESARLRYR